MEEVKNTTGLEQETQTTTNPVENVPPIEEKPIDYLEACDLTSITRRVVDGSYVVTRNGLPYHVPADVEEYKDFFAQLDEYAKAHPEAVEEEHPYVPTAEELAAALQTRYTALIQLWLDEFAQTRGYDHINSACTYATSTDPTFRAEGEYCVALRDATWRTGYALLAEVQTGTRPVPTEDELKALLPVGSAEWPTPNAQAEAAAL